MEVIRPFGPSLAKVSIPIEIVNSLNEYVDKIVADEKKLNELNHGHQLAGNVKQEFRLENEFMKKTGWGKFLADNCAEWIMYASQKKITKFELIHSWIVRQFKDEYNPLHVHSGHISGVGYLKVPDDCGKYFQENKKLNRNGEIELVHGSKMFNSAATITFKPKVGDFYFFPNYLLHTVYPFSNTDQERRSISFNATIDNNIYNVYGA